MELIQVTDEIYEASKRLGNSADALYELGKTKAETERDYRSALAQEMLKLRVEKMPVSIIVEIAKGNVSDKLFQRDLAEARFKAGIEVADAIKVQISAYQSVLKYRTDV